MIYKTIIVLAIISLTACQSFTKENANERSVHLYLHSLNQGNHQTIDQLISDSIKVSDQGYLISKGKKQFHTIFKWDSVFSPSYRLLQIEASEDGVNTIIEKSCQRIRFLQDSASIYKTTFRFNRNRISEIETTGNIYFDTLRWTQNRDTLVNWIKSNHPELDGFIYDQTKEGAENYMKAIKLSLEYKRNRSFIR